MSVRVWFAATLFCGAALAKAEPPFAFESVATLGDMTALIQARFPLGTPRENLRHVFVDEGHGTLKVKPGEPGVEKYLYDIDLCHYYVWCWNISADFDTKGQLRQAYVNGNIVHADGNPKRVHPAAAPEGKQSAILRMQRPRPEAYKGESSLGFLLLDVDGDVKTTGDQFLVGAGPSRADPANMGTMLVYSDVDPWRSIFDVDSADKIAPYPGSCASADAMAEAQRAAQKR